MANVRELKGPAEVSAATALNSSKETADELLDLDKAQKTVLGT